jgi:hypothetical protein
MRKLRKSKRNPKSRLGRLLGLVKNRKYKLRMMPLNQPKVLKKKSISLECIMHDWPKPFLDVQNSIFSNTKTYSAAIQGTASALTAARF